jgi:hypothetical protein
MCRAAGTSHKTVIELGQFLLIVKQKKKKLAWRIERNLIRKNLFQVPGEAELWTVHLAARPQVNVRSVGRKRFAHLSESGEEIQVDANVAWGPSHLFTLEFRPDRLKYAIHACNDKYLSKEGKLVPEINKVSLFI